MIGRCLRLGLRLFAKVRSEDSLVLPRYLRCEILRNGKRFVERRVVDALVGIRLLPASSSRIVVGKLIVEPYVILNANLVFPCIGLHPGVIEDLLHGGSPLGLRLANHSNKILRQR